MVQMRHVVSSMEITRAMVLTEREADQDGNQKIYI
jgi:hypothetical protein